MQKKYGFGIDSVLCRYLIDGFIPESSRSKSLIIFVCRIVLEIDIGSGNQIILSDRKALLRPMELLERLELLEQQFKPKVG